MHDIWYHVDIQIWSNLHVFSCQNDDDWYDNDDGAKITGIWIKIFLKQ